MGFRVLQIRHAKVEDSPALARVQVDSYRTAYAGILPQAYLDHFTYEEQEQDWRKLLSAARSSASATDDILLVAETQAGEIAGYALGRPGPTGIPPYDSELVALHVRQTHQRLGIGRQLISAVAGQLQQRGCKALLLWTLAMNPVRTLYEGLGGQLVGEKESQLGEDCIAIDVAYGWPDITKLVLSAYPGR